MALFWKNKGTWNGGWGCGSGEAQSVSDLKIINVVSWSFLKKEFFLKQMIQQTT